MSQNFLAEAVAEAKAIGIEFSFGDLWEQPDLLQGRIELIRCELAGAIECCAATIWVKPEQPAICLEQRIERARSYGIYFSTRFNFISDLWDWLEEASCVFSRIELAAQKQAMELKAQREILIVQHLEDAKRFVRENNRPGALNSIRFVLKYVPGHQDALQIKSAIESSRSFRIYGMVLRQTGTVHATV